MSLWRLAYSNFKRSVREYLALILALSFSVFVFFNFQNMIYSDSIATLKNIQKDYIDIIIQAASIVFGVFLFFFIGYASGVFLNQRKKEIGIYTFLGLDNGKIGKLYVIEAVCIAVTAVGSGLLFGIGFSKLFQMVIFKLSDLTADVTFSFSIQPVLITCLLFFLFFGLTIVKGYRVIVKSSVFHLLSSAKQEELKAEHPVLVGCKIVFGILVLGTGYVSAFYTGGIDSLGYALTAVILVIAGTYMLFGGMIPFLVRKLILNKRFLYQKQRTLWLNQLSYRIKKNYRTYAMVTVLMICSVTVLAMAIAMNNRYDNLVTFKQAYSYQILSLDPLDASEIAHGISEENEIVYQNQIPCLLLQDTETSSAYGLLSYSDLKEAAKRAGFDFPYEELQEGETVQLSHIILVSFIDPNYEISIADQMFTILSTDETPYLGNLQQQATFYIVNDAVYKELKPVGEEWYLYNYKIADETTVEASRPYLDILTRQEDGIFRTAYMVSQPESNQELWIRIFYALCIFMFATLILASASIIFIKLNNDAWEDRERYQVLQKIGVSREILGKSIRQEICFAYYCPFVLMAVTSWFSVKALGNVMKQNLFSVNLYSALSIFLLFTVICAVSVRIFRKKVL